MWYKKPFLDVKKTVVKGGELELLKNKYSYSA